MTTDFRKQIVWRSYSETESCGFFVWEIYEVIGDKEFINSSATEFVECIDGSYILVVAPNHYWVKENALNFFNEPSDYYVSPILITK